jgi:hypothetical protein
VFGFHAKTSFKKRQTGGQKWPPESRQFTGEKNEASSFFIVHRDF